MPSLSVLAIPTTTTRRIEKLAAEAGRPPVQMLKFVLRDGLEYTEYAVREANAGLAEISKGESLSLSEIKQQIADKSKQLRGKR